MFTNKEPHAYNVILPSATSKEVMEWFEVMDNCNQLSEALIEMVHKSIQTSTCRKGSETIMSAPAGQHLGENQAVLQDNFMDSLYNWQDSTTAIFKEVTEEKKEKKKMLSV